jgi:hypothetical protein
LANPLAFPRFTLEIPISCSNPYHLRNVAFIPDYIPFPAYGLPKMVIASYQIRLIHERKGKICNRAVAYILAARQKFSELFYAGCGYASA